MRKTIQKYRALVHIQSCQQLETGCSKHMVFHVSLIVTTKQKPRIRTQKRKRKKCRHTTTENHQITEEERKGKEQRNLQTARKQFTKWQNEAHT